MIEILKQEPDYLFSINPHPDLLSVSKRLSIPYIAWTVDTPHYQLYSKEMIRNNVFLFVYDSAVVRDLKSKGFRQVYHMPVAANTHRLDLVNVDPKEYQNYQASISFIGSTGKENEYNHFKFERFLPSSLIDRFQNLFKDLSHNPSYLTLKRFVTPQIVQSTEEKLGPLQGEDLLSKEDKLMFFLGRKYTEIERTQIIQSLSQKFDCKVYGDAHWESIQGKQLQYMGYAEHFSEMVKAIKSTKINLNITRVFVKSGLPMRVFDVLGSKSFLLSNDKDELSQFFQEDRDLVIYRDLKDLFEIIPYYLEHEDKRLEIAHNAYEKVKREHTYKHRLENIFDIVQKAIAPN